MDALSISSAQADDPEVEALLGRHHASMRASSPEESCHVMDAASLLAEGVTLLAARLNDVVVGVGGLKAIGPHHGELKSMHTAVEARGQGVAKAVLQALITEARGQGLSKLSLETGSADMFAPARALYAANGFELCLPFGDYRPDPLSVFMSREI